MEIIKRMKKNDFILLGVILGSAALITVLGFFVGDVQSGFVTVQIDGEVTKTYGLSEDRKVELNGGTNVMKIEDGKVDMVEADCPDKRCVKQRAISKHNESIVCLPNKVVLQVVSGDESKLDAVTN